MMGAEESRTKGASLNNSSEAVDQSLEVKEEDTVADYVDKKLAEVERKAEIQSEKLKSLETSFAKLRVENCNLKYQLSFVSEKVVRLEKHDVHFINALKDTITLELLEKIRLLEDRLKTLESPDFPIQEPSGIDIVVIDMAHRNSEGEIVDPEETTNEDLQDFLVYDEDNMCNLSEVAVDEVGRLIETHDLSKPGNDKDQLAKLETDRKIVKTTVDDEAGDMFAAMDEEILAKGLLRRGNVDISDHAGQTMPCSKPKEPSNEENKSCVKILSDVEQLSKLEVDDKLERFIKEITSSLSSSNHQLLSCGELLEELLGLDLTPAMLFKQPCVVYTVESLRHYVCHQDQENNSVGELVKLINSRSEACYLKFSELFPRYTEEKGEFLVFFQEQVQSFTGGNSER